MRGFPSERMCQSTITYMPSSPAAAIPLSRSDMSSSLFPPLQNPPYSCVYMASLITLAPQSSRKYWKVPLFTYIGYQARP